jgi:hypothetical protein
MTTTRPEAPRAGEGGGKGLRVLVCGGRDFNDPLTFGSWMGGLMKRSGIAVIIEGGATGADRMAREFGKWAGIPVETFAADWKTHGRAAGPIRNQRMLTEAKPDIVMAFDGGKGTADMVRRAKGAGVEVFEAPAIRLQ